MWRLTMFKDIAKKAAIASLIAVASVTGVHAMDNQPVKDSLPQQQVSISVSQEAGISLGKLNNLIEKVHKIDTSDIISDNVSIQYIVLDKTHIDSGYAGGDAGVDLSAQNCSIRMPVDSEFSSSFLGTRANREVFKDRVSPSNDEQYFLRTAFSTYHEASHCNFYNIEKPFIASDFQVQQNMNDFFRFSGKHQDSEGRTYSGYYEILNENYADARGAMELIKKHGAGADVISVLEKARIERAETVATTSQFGFDAHSSMYSLEEVLKPEMVEKIKNSSPQELQQMALEVANKGAVKVVATYGNVDQIISQESLMTGATSIALKIHGGELTEASMTPSQNVNLHHDTNKLYGIAQDTLKNLQDDASFNQIKSGEDLKSWFDKNQLTVENEAYNNTNQSLGIEFEKNNNVVGSVADYIKTSEIESKKSLKDIYKEASSLDQKFESIEQKVNETKSQVSSVELPKFKL